MMSTEARTITYMLILVLLSLSFTDTSSRADHEIISMESTVGTLPDLILDQYQELDSEKTSIHSYVWVAQSFMPSMTPLTKVEIEIEKMAVIDYPLEISIRKNLDTSDLAYVSIPAAQIPYYTYWIECDINDIQVVINDTYYIIVRSRTSSGASYRWLEEHDSSHDIYTRGEQWYSNDGGSIWTRTSSSNYFIDSTFRTYSYESYPDLSCDGSFNWTEVEPGAIVTGSFTVSNIGTPLSYLDWKIYQWPSWGTWSFSESSGTDLKPEDGPQTIQVTVEAPHTNIPDTYTGKITIINQNEPDDYEILDATIATPNKKSIKDGISLDEIFSLLKSYLPFFGIKYPF